MAKVGSLDLRKPENGEWRVLGQAVERARNLLGLTLQEFAAQIRRDERQVARWIDGSERPQVDAIFAVKTFRQPLIVALAELADDVIVETVVRIRNRRVA